MAVNKARRRQLSLFAIVGVLVTIGVGQSLHRHYTYEVPWMPGAEKRVWSIEARVQFVARGDSVSVVHEEHATITLSSGYYRVWRQREYSPEEIRVIRD